MREGKTDDVAPVRRASTCATLQRYINFHYSVSLDLFGSEISTNAANFYTMGLKGRFEEGKKRDDHRLKDATYSISELIGDRVTSREAPALPSLNERLRDDYIADCQRGLDRWNQIIKKHEIDQELRLPHRGSTGPSGSSRRSRWRPTAACSARPSGMRASTNGSRPRRIRPTSRASCSR